MRDLIWKIYYSSLVKPILQQKLKRRLSFNWKGLSLEVDPGVFHPGYFFSSTFFAEYLSTLNLDGKLFCDVGTGSGFLGLVAFRSGAKATCLDISPLAVNNAKANFLKNFPLSDRIEILQSDLFDELPSAVFDVIVINPPYFFKDPEGTGSFAWYCGKNGAYFKKLFLQLHNRIHENTLVLMSLADNCEIERIQVIAKENGFVMDLVQRRKIKWEENYIFKIVKK